MRASAVAFCCLVVLSGCGGLTGGGGFPQGTNETLGAPSGLELLAAPPDPDYTFVRREGGLLGEPVYVFRAESTGFPGEPGDGSETNFTATLRVTGDGAVRSYEESIALGEGSMNRSFGVTDVGSTSVPEPEWLDAARANATSK